MQILATLQKRTRRGVSVWNFCREEATGQYFAVGGDKLDIKRCSTKEQLGAMYLNFKRYGYTKELPVQKPVKKQIISDPWQSQLPLDMQLQLDALAAA